MRCVAKTNPLRSGLLCITHTNGIVGHDAPVKDVEEHTGVPDPATDDGRNDGSPSRLVRFELAMFRLQWISRSIGYIDTCDDVWWSDN